MSDQIMAGLGDEMFESLGKEPPRKDIKQVEIPDPIEERVEVTQRDPAVVCRIPKKDHTQLRIWLLTLDTTIQDWLQPIILREMSKLAKRVDSSGSE